MNLKVCIVIWFSKFLYGSCTSREIFLKEYLGRIERADVLAAHLCWNPGDYIKLHRALNEIFIRHMIVTSDYISENHCSFHRIFITDVNCPFFDSLIEKAYRKGLLKYPNKWIIFGNATNLEDKNFYFPIDSYTVIVQELASNETLKVQALYKISNDSRYFQNPIGLWLKNKGFLFYKELVIVINRTDFYGMPLRVSYILLDNSSFSYLTDNKHKHVDQISKINYVMFEKLVNIWNMTHVALITNDWGLGFDPQKLYYNGMLGDLCHDRADVAGTVMFMPVERLKYFKYLVSTVKYLTMDFIFKAPSLAYSTNLFALPFDRNVWIGCAIILSFCGLVIWIIVKWEINEDAFEETHTDIQGNKPGLLDVVLTQIAVVCQMDCPFEPRSMSGKIALFTLLLGFSYIYIAFTARIVILLQSTATNINDVQDLYKAKIEIGVEDTPYNRFYYTTPAKRTNEKLRKLVYEKSLKGKKFFFTAPEGIKLVRNSRFAFQAQQATASNLIEASFTNQEKCSVKKVENIFKTDIAYLSTPKNSSLAEYMLIGFHKLFETGIHAREATKRFHKLPTCVGKNSVFVSVGLQEASFAFEIFIFGVLASILVLMLEFSSYVYIKHSNSRVQPFI